MVMLKAGEGYIILGSEGLWRNARCPRAFWDISRELTIFSSKGNYLELFRDLIWL